MDTKNLSEHGYFMGIYLQYLLNFPTKRKDEYAIFEEAYDFATRLVEFKEKKRLTKE